MRVTPKKITNKCKLTSLKKTELKLNYNDINKMKKKKKKETENVRKKKKSNHKFSFSIPHQLAATVFLETKSFLEFYLFFTDKLRKEINKVTTLQSLPFFIQLIFHWQ